MATPRASILIATYNRRRLLEQALASALSHTERDLEVVVVDDESDDATQRWMRANADARVRYVRHSSHLGAAAAWRTGMEVAKGEFLAFLADDDAFAASFVATRLGRLETHAECAVAFSRFRVHTEDGEVLSLVNGNFGEERVLDCERLLQAALGNRLFLRTGLYRRNALQELPGRVLNVGTAFEYAINVEIALRGGRNVFIPIEDIVDLDHPGQTRHDSLWQQRYARRANFLRRTLSEMDLSPYLLRAGHRELSSWHTVWGRRHLDEGDSRAARSHFLRALKWDPRNPWPWKQLARSSMPCGTTGLAP